VCLTEPGSLGLARETATTGGMTLKLTYTYLRAILDAAAWSDDDHAQRSVAITIRPAEGNGNSLVPDGSVTIHDHPGSGRPREIHFMVDGQKVAEFGPPDGAEGQDSDIAPGYIDFLGEFMGKPVYHADWKNRIMADNGLLPDRDHLDELAKCIAEDVVGLYAVTEPPMIGMRERHIIDEAEELAKAVLAAHTIHASYNDALATMEGRVRSS
jgi:hypothetical protein